jgi:hypothetical protein
MRPSKWLVFIRPSLAGFDRPLTPLDHRLLAWNPPGSGQTVFIAIKLGTIIDRPVDNL